ncbi:hypothetical protein F4778DRAFT_773218 [Xylariomycetidae sp. FL2044]|nr:hypothetical protein F4778DRAFT_773218 [Xylariomycetidae sp. FL2044]
MQGSLSYTVVRTSETIVSFRRPESKLDDQVLKLAKRVHGDLVPEATFMGKIGNEKDDGKHLLAYSMPYLPGKTAFEILVDLEVDTDKEAEENHLTFVKDFARYFARSYAHPQRVGMGARMSNQEQVWNKLSKLKAKSSEFPFLQATLKELDDKLNELYESPYPQVLTHGDLSMVNILIDPDTHAITGLVDWSRASVAPFGLELRAFRMSCGIMNRLGWNDFQCRPRMEALFWEEFFSATEITDPKEQANVREMAELGCKLGAILQFAFENTLSGAILDEFRPRPKANDFLEAWFRYPAWDKVVRSHGEQNGDM